jgi:hypothetical protein
VGRCCWPARQASASPGWPWRPSPWLGLAEEFPVGGLSPEAVAALAGVLLGGEPPAALLGVLRERAGGMPLFVTALIRGLRDTGELFRSGGAWVLGSGSLTAVPPVVRDLVLARLERLDPADRRRGPGRTAGKGGRPLLAPGNDGYPPARWLNS